MEYVDSFSMNKAGRAYITDVYNLHPDSYAMSFHVDSGASVTFLGLNSFCDPEDYDNYNLFKNIVFEELQKGNFEKQKNFASTATKEEIEMYPCRMDGVSIGGTKPITLHFCLYMGNIGMPLLGFDYLDDCSFQHMIGGDWIISAIADNVGKRFYPERLLDFNKVIERFRKER